MTMVQKIKQIIENMFELGKINNIIIYPFGDIGMSIKNILNVAYGVTEDYIVDDNTDYANVLLIPQGEDAQLDKAIEVINEKTAE